MPPEGAPQTYQDALDALSKVADANGNCFRLKVVRRPNAASSTSVHIGTFGNATWQQIADAESWLQPFCGGGLYILQIFDGKDARRQYGTITPSEITGQPRQPNAAVCRSTSWMGPDLISSSSDNGAGATALSQFSGLAGGPHSGDAPRTQTEAGLSGLFDEVTRRDNDLRQREAALAEQQRRLEVESIRRESREQAARLEARVSELLAAAKTPPPPPPPSFDIGGFVSTLVASAVPIVAKIMDASTEARKAILAAEAAQRERDREDRAREREEREALAKRPIIDPQIMEILDRQSKAAQEQLAQFSTYLRANAETAKANAESQAVTQRSIFQMIIESAQLQLKSQGGEREEGIDWPKVIAGALGGLAALKQGGVPGQPAMGGMPGQPAPGQLPPQQQQPAPEGPPVPESPLLNTIEERIRKKDPPDEVVTELKSILEEATVKAEIEAEGGLLNVFDARLGDFASDEKNSVYMTALMAALQRGGFVPAD